MKTEIAAAVAIACVLALAVALPALRLRTGLREQVLLREGQVLQAVVAMQYAVETAEMESLGLVAADVDDFTTMLKTARLPGVIGVRLFNRRDSTQDVFPPELNEGALTAADWDALGSLTPVVRMHADYPLAELILTVDQRGTAELIEVIVPLPARGDAQRAAQFWIAGTGIAAELARQDRALIALAAIVWIAGTCVALGIQSIASRKLRRANAELRRRGDDLSRANQELALAAKVSAVGVVAAHLIHGLKNPLQGLRGLAVEQKRASGNGDGKAAWADAAAMTGRLQAMVDDVTALLTDEASGIQFRVTCEEMMQVVTKRTGDIRNSTGVEMTWTSVKGLEFDNRLAALVGLIVSNLVTNACEASKPGAGVHVEILRKRGMIEIAVSDRGCGIPSPKRERLFLPAASTKPHGSGIGLAVSRNLAQHIQATLELEETGPAGTVFVLRIPVSEEVKQP
ncbi:MAG TPA: sensor histidine kinase [Opitutaceae bacterium]|nr:sensor histidine kinase [Opitutaceae bacterium]